MSQFNPEEYVNLAAERLGATVVDVSDEFFAPADNMLKEGRGIFIADKYTDNGKWMDGWESRRKRVEGHDWCILKLGLYGDIKGFDIDTNHFLGNHPPEASVEACETFSDFESGKWQPILKKVALKPGSQNIFSCETDKSYRFLRLNIFPDGGVARFKVYGDVQPNWDQLKKETSLDLVAVQNGGKVMFCNDMFFSSKDNLIMPGRGINMGDGWETKRRREPGNDWVVLQCGKPGIVERIEVDTHHFKGNYPDRISIEGVYAPDASEAQLKNSNDWVKLVPEVKTFADRIHFFPSESDQPVSHVRMQIYPDGGVSRLRVWGRLHDQ